MANPTIDISQIAGPLKDLASEAALYAIPVFASILAVKLLMQQFRKVVETQIGRFQWEREARSQAAQFHTGWGYDGNTDGGLEHLTLLDDDRSYRASDYWVDSGPGWNSRDGTDYDLGNGKDYFESSAFDEMREQIRQSLGGGKPTDLENPDEWTRDDEEEKARFEDVLAESSYGQHERQKEPEEYPENDADDGFTYASDFHRRYSDGDPF